MTIMIPSLDLACESRQFPNSRATNDLANLKIKVDNCMWQIM